MSDTGITPIVIAADPSVVFDALQYLDGEELDLLDEWGIHLSDLDKQIPNRLFVALGYFTLRRKHPDLSYEDGRKLVRVTLFDDSNQEPKPVDPTVAAD